MSTYRCPECGKAELRVEMSAVYSIDPDDELSYDSEPPTVYDIADDALMICNICEHGAPAKEFVVDAPQFRVLKTGETAWVEGPVEATDGRDRWVVKIRRPGRPFAIIAAEHLTREAAVEDMRGWE